MKNKILITIILSVILIFTLLSIYTIQANNNYTATNKTNITLTSTKLTNTQIIEITCVCDIINTKDNIVTIEYRDNTYQYYVKDPKFYTNLSQAIVTFTTSNIDNLSTYKIINIQQKN